VRYELVEGACTMEMVARSSLHPVRVEATAMTGSLEASDEDGQLTVAPGAHLEVRLDELRSGNALIDRETRRRLDLRRHPRLLAELNAARPAARDVLACTGAVTFQGRTCTVAGELRVSRREGGVLAFAGEHLADVRRWGLEPPRLLVLRVDPEVHVRLQLLARPVPPGP
jgi:hypothetical protein